MKKLILFCTSFLFISILFSNELRVTNPLDRWSSESANIDSAFITITPQNNYALVEIISNYSAKGTYLGSNNGGTWLEVVTAFNIPKNTIVIDSWLWIEDYISEAHLIDLYTANSIYESYVVRTQDPSLLQYTRGFNDRLNLNIYPVPANTYRKVKLSFLVPMKNEITSHSLNPISNLFIHDNESAPSYCEIKVNHNSIYNEGTLRTSPWNYSIKERGGSYTTYLMDMNAIDQNFVITYDKSSPNDFFTYHAGYYSFEKYIPFNYGSCFIGGIEKVMDNSSIVYDEHTRIQEYPAGFVVCETGKYFNNPPQNFVLEYVCYGNIVKDSLNLQGYSSPIVKSLWARDKINELTENIANNNPYYYNTSREPFFDEIVSTSRAHRVLSFYTAFLALPRGDTSLVTDDYDENNPEFATTIERVAGIGEVQMNAYPNTFTNYISIEINLEKDISKEEYTIRIIDMNGATVKYLESINSDDKKIIFNNINTTELSKGIYFIQLDLPFKSMVFKMIKE